MVIGKAPRKKVSLADPTDILVRELVDGITKKYGDGTARTGDKYVKTVADWASSRNFMIDTLIAGGMPTPGS